MKSRFKLISTIMAAMFVVVMGSMGVLALKEANVSTGGSISFSPDFIDATVSAGTFSHCTGHDGKMQTFNITKTTTDENIETATNSWKGLDLTFVEGQTATIEFTITNNAPETGRSNAYIKVTPNWKAGTLVNATSECSLKGVTTIAPTKGLTITLTFKMTDSSLSASVTNFSLDLALEAAASAAV